MKVTLITARLRFDTAGGVTGTETRTGEHGHLQPLRRQPHHHDGTDGQVTLPGTTIAGSLRAHCTAIDSQLGDLFGDSPEQLADKHARAKRTGTAEPATPSAIQVLGTVLHTGGEIISHTRNTTDRHRSAACNHEFHRVEMLAAGTEFDVVLRWDNPDPTLLRDRFLPALTQWHPTLGRGVTRGAGQCTLVTWGTTDYDLNSPDGLLAWLQDTHSAPYPEPAQQPPEPAHPEYIVDAELSIIDALHCGTEQEPTGRDDHNFLTVFRHGDNPVVPGSTLKGVLRSRAEYICRVIGLHACPDQRCGHCRPCRLFGFTNEQTAQRGRIAVDDATIEDATIELRPHVAIDRFTGGARTHALYEHEVVTTGRFPLRVRRITPGPPADKSTEDDQDLRLLHAALQDIHDGYIGIGARTTAGYGTVQITTPRCPQFELNELAAALRDPIPQQGENP